ncbi:MAG: hypothetical protein AAFQ80_05205 [Cyanobacteria bacterium J06621_8]
MISQKSAQSSSDRLTRNSLLFLLLWIGIGVILRFTNLALKPASSIEIATIGYSLGHGFNQIPLNQLVSLPTLLAPLRLDPNLGYLEVLHRLTQESTHPPLYFWLSHWWFKLWLQEGDLVSLSVARSLSALCGILAIPASFTLAWVAFRSRLGAHFAAVLMAVSPYGIYLSQEARHYTLTILWVMASFTCLIRALQLISQRRTVPWYVTLGWIVINVLGVATHYFFVLTLGAEAIALGSYWLLLNNGRFLRYCRSLLLVSLGTIAGTLVWLPLLGAISQNQMTTWIATSYSWNEVLLPLPRLLVWLITMVMLLPVEGVSSIMAIASGIVLLTVLGLVLPTLLRQWRKIFADNQTRGAITVIAGYLLGSLGLFLVLIYGLGKDVSLAARYHFVYFPLIILLVAIALASCWQQQLLAKAYSKVVLTLLVMSLLGSLTVINNLGFQKSRRSNQLAAYIQQQSSPPTIVAMTHQTHSEIRELTALGLSFTRLNSQLASSQLPQFLLVNQEISAAEILKSSQARLFGINLDIGDATLQQWGCQRDQSIDLSDSGYRDRFYICSK